MPMESGLHATMGLLLEPEGARRLITLLPVTAARPFGFILLLPVLSRFHLNVGYLRGALVVALVLPVLPAAIAEAARDPALLTTARMPAVLATEFLVGVLLGLLAGLPFWAAMAAGDYMDMQRGAQMAELLDPGSGDQQTVSGTLLLLVCVLVLAAKGMLVPALFGPVLDSYAVVPLFSTLPQIDPAQGALVLRLLDTLARTGLLLALPVLVPLLLVEVAVAVATKYIPQLNAMFLSMSVKQGIHALLLVLYAVTLAGYAISLAGSAELRPGALEAFISGAAQR